MTVTDNGKYDLYISELRGVRPGIEIYTDELRRLAWGTDAGFYRLVPQVVVRLRDVEDAVAALKLSKQFKLPVTFRAAGTSLSGQAITDSILLVAGKHWEDYEILADGQQITLQPGIIGKRVNEILAPYGRYFAPDPASKNAAMVGGIIVNNASGMSCGTHANSDRVLRSVKMVLADGSLLDTGSENSRKSFARTHPEVLAKIERIRQDIVNNPGLVSLIRHKYSIKNVMGLNLLPFVTFSDPYDIMAHCLVGSEGTLAFLASATVNTTEIKKYSASAMLYFSDLAEACRCVVALKKNGRVDACELLDSKSLEAVHDSTGSGLTALLLEVRASTEEQLKSYVNEIENVISPFTLFKEAHFTTDPEESGAWWAIRSGVFPAVGGTRPAGTTALIEDVAFHIDSLTEATVELRRVLEECGYDDACIYGHALEGNYHFIIAQGFENDKDIARYRELMLRTEQLVIDRHGGSLKAEHGTGRNMAPFVRKEWGDEAFEMMKRIKEAFDPDGLLNPGVIFNDDPECFIRNLKELPTADSAVDACIECGFCEPHCVSCGLTLSARQRIVAARRMAALERSGKNPEELEALRKGFRYYGNETCAGDGLCSTGCPMKINTGVMIHHFRDRENAPGTRAYRIGAYAARHLAGVSWGLRGLLGGAGVARLALGRKATDAVGRALHGAGVPLWTASLPLPATPCKISKDAENNGRKMVYFPSCINRVMGRTPRTGVSEPLTEVTVRLCKRAGFEVIYPDDMASLCCGLTWESKGMPQIADEMVQRLARELRRTTEGGRYPVLCDQSPCLHRMREHIPDLKMYEPVEFISLYLLPHLHLKPVDRSIAVHVTCSSRLMGLEKLMSSLAQSCTTRPVLVPAEVGCCGFAGDKGFTHPELNAYGLRKLRPQIEKAGVTDGYSNSRTCEIGLTQRSGVDYKNIIYLVEEATRDNETD
ncbi:MAG: FAD-binding oxidoreductase [Muribaculaceae bacterium]|nr:FAD-binding oxidoreductase [Muribaculaceae bacterium]